MRHIVKGLDFEETIVSLMVLAALWNRRDEFVAPRDPSTVRPFLQALIGLAAIGGSCTCASDHVGYSDGSRTGVIVAAVLAVRAL